MADADEAPKPGKGKAFFDRADQVASTSNWDFAIEMYLEGILREPENIERGHQKLREVAMKRKAQGGKGPGMMEGLKFRPGKDPLQNLRNAEYLLAKEPGSVQYMEHVLAASIALENKVVAQWIGDLMMTVAKLDKRTLVGLINAFETIASYKDAVAAINRAIAVAPGDEGLKDRLRALEARATLDAGQYGVKGAFTKGVKDMEAQKDLLEKDKFQQGRGYLEAQIERARKEYEATPTVPGKINGLVDALLKIEEEGFEEEAVAVLNKGFTDTKAYQFKMRVGDVRMRQMKRRYAKLLAAGQREAALQQAKRQLEFELAEFTERAANYPTDLSLKYELGRRQFLAGKGDEAIASLQQAQRDPRRHVSAMSLLGQCYARKGWFQEASDTYEKVLQAEMTEERRKEILYNLGDVKEKLEKLPEAMEFFSQLVQIDYNYKDTRQRIEDLRKRMQAPTGETGATT